MTLARFAKGHGTKNDFVLLDDPEGVLPLKGEEGADVVRRLCDRHGGIGGDGVIRVTRARNVAELGDRAGDIDPDLWFMDYRNADGSIAEMCGNGSRVTAEYLARFYGAGDQVLLGTRAGVKPLNRTARGWRVGLGQWRLARETEALERGMDCVVQVLGAPEPLPGLSIDLGNPHAVVALPPTIDLGSLDLREAPHIDPHPAEGSNVEFVRAIEHGHIAMRVSERGVGETQSCGTGVAAAAIATWWWGGQPDDQRSWRVDVPGGTLWSHIEGRVEDSTGVDDTGVEDTGGGHADESAGNSVDLEGPAVIVATGEIEI